MAIQQQDGGLLEAERTRLKPPPLFKVLLLNDDYTPMDFVVVVLQTVFAMSREKATQVMLQVHREGMGVCGTYTREVAVAKVDQAPPEEDVMLIRDEVANMVWGIETVVPSTSATTCPSRPATPNSTHRSSGDCWRSSPAAARSS